MGEPRDQPGSVWVALGRYGGVWKPVLSRMRSPFGVFRWPLFATDPQGREALLAEAEKAASRDVTEVIVIRFDSAEIEKTFPRPLRITWRTGSSLRRSRT